MVETVLAILLHGHALRLHMVNADDPRPLVVYATGDGGWHRKDADLFKHIAALGLPAVGFDARDYVTHLGAPTVSEADLAADYARMIARAKDGMRIPAERPVVLLGVSRGAGLAVIAADEGGLGAPVAGVLAVALTAEEEFVTGQPEPYEDLPRLGDIPVAVVQSTRDGYLPSDAARGLFGPDTPYRWFQAVQARNHSFGGARPQLYLAVRRALTWLLGVRSPDRSDRGSGLPIRGLRGSGLRIGVSGAKADAGGLAPRPQIWRPDPRIARSGDLTPGIVNPQT